MSLIDPADLVGAWHLIGWELRGGSQPAQSLLRDETHGKLIYTSDGEVLGMISVGATGRMAADAFHLATVEERSRAASNFMAYGGRYTVEGDVVVHHLEVCLFPNWVGTDQRRVANIDDDDVLTLTAQVDWSTSGANVHSFIWRRSTPRVVSQAKDVLR